MDLFNRKAKFEDVRENEEALLFHAVRWQSGSRYELAKLCFQFVQLRKNK